MNKNSPQVSHLRFIRWSLFGSFAVLLASAAFAQGRHAIGLSARNAQLWLEEGAYPHNPGNANEFGSALAAGDFNGDGFADLASGAPGNDCDPQEIRCGAVQVRIGGASAALTSRIVLSPAPNNNDLANADELYGSALAAGDFNGDGRDDLAVGIPRNYVQAGAAQVRAGSVQLHFGLPSALQPLQEIATYSFAENALGVLPGAPSSSEGFGQAVAFGDFNGDLKDDLAVGIPYDRSLCGTTPCAAGAVMVIDLDDSLLVHGYQMSLGRQGLPGNPVADDEYGYAVAAGDFNGDGYADLATGIPQREGVGAVLVVYGSEFSLLFGAHQLLNQGSFGELPEPGDDFGRTLAAGDFNHDGFADLAMGAPGEDLAGAGQFNVGLVIVSYGSAEGLRLDAAPWLSENGIFGSGSEIEDRFGSALTAGDWNGDGKVDLAIGAAGESGVGGAGSGAVTVILGRELGLAGSPARQLSPGNAVIGMIAQRPGETDEFAGFGAALAAGDFDGNGFADLAIGAPQRQLAPNISVGAVGVVYGQLFLDGLESGDALEWSGVAP